MYGRNHRPQTIVYLMENLQYKLTAVKVFVLVRAWKYLECGGNSFTVRYTGNKLSVEDLCTVAPSVLCECYIPWETEV